MEGGVELDLNRLARNALSRASAGFLGSIPGMRYKVPYCRSRAAELIEKTLGGLIPTTRKRQAGTAARGLQMEMERAGRRGEFIEDRSPVLGLSLSSFLSTPISSLGTQSFARLPLFAWTSR
jgi:hypothetical protein